MRSFADPLRYFTAALIVRTLDQLGRGEASAIRAIHADGQLGQRLYSLGLLPGAVVRVIQVAPFGDPFTVQVAGFQVSLRRAEAKTIEIDGATA